MAEWKNIGDIHPLSYGGTLFRVKKKPYYDVEFVHITYDDRHNRYMFHGTITDLSEMQDYTDFSVDKYPEDAAYDLITSYGCGVFEFSPCNLYDQGAYSMNYYDFLANDDVELRRFLTKIGVPAEMQRGSRFCLSYAQCLRLLEGMIEAGKLQKDFFPNHGEGVYIYREGGRGDGWYFQPIEAIAYELSENPDDLKAFLDAMHNENIQLPNSVFMG